MPRQWTLVVDGFGKIDHAEVRLHPLMLFVGDNNSGKSMLMSLLWGMYALRWDLFADKPPTESASHRACEEWLRERYAELQHVPAHELTEDDKAILLRWLNDRISDNRAGIAHLLFDDEMLAPSMLELCDTQADSSISLSRQRMDPENIDQLVIISKGRGDFGHFNAMDSEQSRYNFLCRLVIWTFLRPNWGATKFDGSYLEQDPVYFPASRSGFMLLLKDVVRRRSRRADRISEEGSGLTAPVLHFLDLLAFGLKKIPGIFGEEAALLERKSYDGQIELAPGDVVNDFHYRYSEGRRPLRMALSSSLVTELAPVVMVLRHLSDFPILILEEPEAHLHPKLQRVLARVIARLVRKGLWVWVTTHNENFCQQINNFIKIGSHPERDRILREEGYEANDYLLVEEVAGYQFVNQGARSQVSELPKTDQGLAMPTFNEELISLQKQTLRLEAEAEKTE